MKTERTQHPKSSRIALTDENLSNSEVDFCETVMEYTNITQFILLGQFVTVYLT